MIVIAGTITIDPANTEVAAPLIATLVEATNAEAGCITYGFTQSITQPGHYSVFEEWADEDALNSHMASAHMGEFLVAAGSLGITGTDISRYDVSTKTKFM